MLIKRGFFLVAALGGVEDLVPVGAKSTLTSTFPIKNLQKYI
jgi:hypothetical protein